MPLNEPNRSKWIESIEKYQPFDYVIQTYHVCSNHFCSNDIEIKGKRKLVKSGRFPSIFPNNGTDQNYLQAEDDVTARSIEVPYEPIENDDVTENFGIVTADASDQSDTRSNDEQLICVDDNGANDTKLCPN